MSTSHEPSYYEIALTNRQVLVVFVVLLAAVVASFFAGVWVGREGRLPAEPVVVQRAEGDAAQPPLEEFRFFTEEEGEEVEPAARLPRSRPGGGKRARPAGGEGSAGQTLLEDLGGEDPGRVLAPDAGTAGAEGVSDPDAEAESEEAFADTALVEREPVEADTPPGAAPAPIPPPSSEVTAGDLVIQVFSTSDRGQAARIMERLVAGGFPAFLSPVAVQGQTLHRVRIGPFGERAEAESTARRVRETYKLDTWITTH